MVGKCSVAIAIVSSFFGVSLLFFLASRHSENHQGWNAYKRSINDININAKKTNVGGNNSTANPSKNKECHAAECVKVATYIRNSLNTSVDPCEDFYRFSCEGWIKRNPIPKSYNDYSTFTKLAQEIEDELRSLLEKHDKLLDDESNTEYEALRKAKNFFKSCMDEDEIERLGPQPALDFIHDIGSWSLATDGSWNKSRWDPYDVLRNLHKSLFPAPPFFSVEVTNDHLNSTKHLIKVR